MRKFVIERDLPEAGKLSPQELKKISKTSCDTVNNLEAPYHWLETFVTDNKLYCFHIAEDESVIREHSKKAGFPVNSIREVKTVIDPTTSR